MPYADPEARRRTVLVAVVNNRVDFARARDEGWYRIPQRRAPRRIGADYLALYQTGAFKGDAEAQHVAYYAPTRRYRLMTRAEMMPEEAGHPRADDYYFRVDLGELIRLPRPVPAHRMRRVTFIHTTLDRLFSADDVLDLFYQEDPFDRLWHALREAGLRPLPNRIIMGEPMDITLRARGGYLGIRCGEDGRTAEAATLPERWETLHLAPTAIERNLDDCLRRVARALLELGGSDLRQTERPLPETKPPHT
jgi:hypothetical protein